jgi:acyl dehydratase
MNQLSERYLEDFAVGQTFGSGRLRIEGERALAFAAEFDPQPSISMRRRRAARFLVD